MIYKADTLKDWDCSSNINGKWVMSRPVQLGMIDRIKTAWEVLRGRCDGLKWEGQ